MVASLKKLNISAKNGIYKLGQLLQEARKKDRNFPFDEKLANFAKNIQLDIEVKTKDVVILNNNEIVQMSHITQKQLYDDAIIKTTTDHEHQTKWVDKLQTVILWEEVWKVVHNCLLTSKTKTIIWEQIHLNFYTQ